MYESAKRGFSTATDLADYLVRKGMPFRQAHEAVGKAVLRASHLGCGLGALPVEEYRRISPLIGEDVYDALSLDASVGRRTSSGGTAPENVKRRVLALRKELKRI